MMPGFFFWALFNLHYTPALFFFAAARLTAPLTGPPPAPPAVTAPVAPPAVSIPVAPSVVGAPVAPLPGAWWFVVDAGGNAHRSSFLQLVARILLNLRQPPLRLVRLVLCILLST